MENSIIKRDIVGQEISKIEDFNLSNILNLINENTKRNRKEMRENGLKIRELEDRLNNISSILIHDIDIKNIEKALSQDSNII